MTINLYSVQEGDTVQLQHDATGIQLGPITVVKTPFPVMRMEGKPVPTNLGVQMPTPDMEQPWVWPLDTMCDDGWVILSAERPLPTEPGVYQDRDGELWTLTRAGTWTDVATGEPNAPSKGVKDRGPFERLVPESEIKSTAREVLKRVLRFDFSMMDSDAYAHLVAHANVVGREFGVTSIGVGE